MILTFDAKKGWPTVLMVVTFDAKNGHHDVPRPLITMTMMRIKKIVVPKEKEKGVM